MAWIELHQSLMNHKKIIRLKNLLKIEAPHAMGLVCNLWLWAVDNASDGDLSEFSAEELSEVCGYKKDPQVFLKAMVDAGFIDKKGKRKQIHDWSEYTGRLMESREIRKEQARVRQAKRREKLKASKTAEKRNNDVTQGNVDVTRDNSVSHAHIHYSTLHYTTVPDNSGGGDSACARVCEGECEELYDDDTYFFPENIAQHNEVMGQIRALPSVVRERFFTTVDNLYSTLWNKTPSEYDYSQLYCLIRWMHYSKEHGWQPVQMTEDDVELLSYSFEAAANADKKFVAYIRGVYHNYKRRGIKTVDDLICFEMKRDFQ